MSADISSKPLIKRACDACKVRKVRCSNTTPCAGCVAIGTACTFNKHQGIRGPRKLRAKTIHQIAESQRSDNGAAIPVMDSSQRMPSVSPSVTSQGNRPGPAIRTLSTTERPLPSLVASPPAASPSSQMPSTIVTPIATLVLHLCVYRLRMFPVWPIVAVEDLMGALQKDGEDMGAYALANAVAAATVAQLRLEPLKNSKEFVTVESMEREAQRVRMMGKVKLNLNHLRTALFLHFYQENIDPGGIKSMLYLRETITMAQMMGLHKEATYRDLSLVEQQFRKRVLWLLFVTERSVAVLHKLPIVLKSNISFPAMEYDEDVSILPAFRKVVNLYWIFDKSEAFELLQNSRLGVSTPQSVNLDDLSLLRKQLQEITIGPGSTNDVQAADICVTRTWMCAVLWRIATNCGLTTLPDDVSHSLIYPSLIAKEFLDVVSRLPTTAVEAHGPAMELKIYGIACSVAESICKLDLTGTSASWEEVNPRDVLDQLQSLLSSCRGGSPKLVEKIRDRCAGLQTSPQEFPQVTNDWANRGNPDQGQQSDQNIIQRTDPRAPNEPATMTGFSSGSVPGPAINTPSGSAEMNTQELTPFPWDSIAENTQMDLSHDLVNVNQSAAFERFLNETMGDNWTSMRNTPGPVSQWL